MNHRHPSYKMSFFYRVEFNTMVFNTVEFNTMVFNTVEFNTMEFNTVVFNTRGRLLRQGDLREVHALHPQLSGSREVFRVKYSANPFGAIEVLTTTRTLCSLKAREALSVHLLSDMTSA